MKDYAVEEALRKLLLILQNKGVLTPYQREKVLKELKSDEE
jgi:hypothetical protein